LYAFLTSPICATCPAHLILLHLITLIKLGVAYTLRNSSLCSLLQSTGTSSPKVQISSSRPVLRHPQSVIVLWCDRLFHTHTKQQVKSRFLYFLICTFTSTVTGREDKRLGSEREQA
jgi:hypothetical protein